MPQLVRVPDEPDRFDPAVPARIEDDDAIGDIRAVTSRPDWPLTSTGWTPGSGIGRWRMPWIQRATLSAPCSGRIAARTFPPPSVVLENIATLAADGSYLGAFSIPRHSRPGELYLDAVDHAQAETTARPSIVHGQIAAALRGQFGDVQFTERTRASTLFVNPLMAIYFTFDLDGIGTKPRG